MIIREERLIYFEEKIQSATPSSEAEASYNSESVFDLFNAGASYEIELELGKSLKESWYAAAKHQFPDREFVVELAYDGDCYIDLTIFQRDFPPR